MSHNTNKNVPAIRFAGFEGVWMREIVGDIMDIYHGRDYKREPKNEGTYPVVGTGGVITKIDTYLCDWACVCIGRKGTINKPQYFETPFWSVDTLFYSKWKEGNDPRFQYYLFHNIPWISYNEASGVPSLNAGTIQQIPVYVAPLEEQICIGQFFRALDKLIELRQKKLERLILLKKQLLNKLFPRQGQKVPDIRFAGFEGEWRKGLLKDITEINPKTEVPDFFEYVDLESVSGTSLVSHRAETKETAPSRACRRAECGDIFYQMVRPYQRNNFLFNMRRNDYVFSSGYAQLRPSVNSLFLMGLVQTDVFVSEVLQNCTGTSYPAVAPSTLSMIPLCYPSKSKEQSRIGQFFQTLDKLIELRQKELDKQRVLKRVLLVKMFA